MLDVWGDPVTVKTTPAGNRCRVALGRGCPPDAYGIDGWELRVTDPEDDYGSVFCALVEDDRPEAAVMRSDPEAYWAKTEAALMAMFDTEVAPRRT